MHLDDLDRELREARPAAPDRLVGGLSERLRQAARPRRPRAQLAFAAALALVAAAVFGGFGGIGYAAAAAKKAAAAAKAVAAPAPAAAGAGPSGGGGGPAAPASQSADKVAICHRTRSASNPYVLIVVAQAAVPAHRRHDDPPDIIPAPPGGCPAGAGDGPAQDQYAGKVPICHRTRSATNPYVLIVVAQAAVPAHRRHDDPPDIIPAPPTGCPSTP